MSPRTGYSITIPLLFAALVGALSLVSPPGGFAAPAFRPIPTVEPPSSAPQVAFRLTVKVKSNVGGYLPARIQVQDLSGNPFEPVDPSVPFYRAYTGHNYFYAAGPADLDVPPGPVRIILSHGPEFEAVDDTINVTGNTTVSYTLHALFPMRRDGWYSGDTHTHIAHGGEGDAFTITPTDLARIANAEDLAVTCALSNGTYFTGGPDPAGDLNHIVYFGMEYRSALYGHMGILGLSALLPFGCCLPGDPPYPSNYEVARNAGLQNATVILSHPVPMDPAFYAVSALDWPFSGFGREFPVDLVLGGIQAIDICSYSNYSNAAAREVWYDALDLGYRIPPSVGTDASVNRDYDPPIGGYRLYVKLPWGVPLTLDRWLAGLRSGESYATNGPLVTVSTINGRVPGSTLAIDPDHPTQLTGFLSMSTREPIDYVDVIHNGAILSRISVPASARTFDLSYSVSVPPVDGWLVLIPSGDRPHPSTIGGRLEAVVAPTYLRAGKTPPVRAQARETFLGWIDLLEQMVINRGDVGSPGEVAEVLATIDRGRRRIAGRHGDGEDGRDDVADPGDGTTDLRVLGSAVDHDFRLAATGQGEGRLEVYDVQGRLLVAGAWQSLAEGFSWDGTGRLGRAPAGVYFARVRTREAVGRAVRLVLLD